MCSSIGLFIFTMDLLTLIVCLIFGNPDGDKNFLNSIFYYFKEAGAGTIILRLFLEYVFLDFSLIHSYEILGMIFFLAEYHNVLLKIIYYFCSCFSRQ